MPFTGSGNPQTVHAITRDDILAAHDAWIRPDNAKIFVAGDTSLAEIVPLLEARFGHWQAPATRARDQGLLAPPSPTRGRGSS